MSEQNPLVGRHFFYFVTKDRNQDGVVLASLGEGFFCAA